jgi:hypothetical protein
MYFEGISDKSTETTTAHMQEFKITVLLTNGKSIEFLRDCTTDTRPVDIVMAAYKEMRWRRYAVLNGALYRVKSIDCILAWPTKKGDAK